VEAVMQMSEAYRRQREWGEMPCGHRSVEPEYYLGSHTGDHVCIVCGNVVESDEADSGSSS
jgi:hypothetical protein